MLRNWSAVLVLLGTTVLFVAGCGWGDADDDGVGGWGGSNSGGSGGSGGGHSSGGSGGTGGGHVGGAPNVMPLNDPHKFAINAVKPEHLELQGDLVLDHHTGLVWTRGFKDFTPKNVNDPRQAVADARAYCDALSLGGFDDWRLPTRLELLSIADHTRLRPAIDPKMFPDVYTKGRSPFWTTTPHVAEHQYFAIGFDDGAVTYDGDVTKPVRARCVRDPNPGETVEHIYTVEQDTVKDNRTGLVWQRHAPETKFPTADDAIAYCKKLSLDGGGWRLPNVKELNTIIDESRASPAIDVDAFPGTKSNWYWSSTPYHGFKGYWWAVTFRDSASYINEAKFAYARCVR